MIATVKVVVALEITVRSAWADSCTISQVKGQATQKAWATLRSAIGEDNPPIHVKAWDVDSVTLVTP